VLQSSEFQTVGICGDLLTEPEFSRNLCKVEEFLKQKWNGPFLKGTFLFKQYNIHEHFNRILRVIFTTNRLYTKIGRKVENPLQHYQPPGTSWACYRLVLGLLYLLLPILRGNFNFQNIFNPGLFADDPHNNLRKQSTPKPVATFPGAIWVYSLNLATVCHQLLQNSTGPAIVTINSFIII
jgi:hypothetical protein